MSFEVWIFNGERKNGGLLAVEDLPPSYSRGDAERMAQQITEQWLLQGEVVSTVVRCGACY